MSESVSTSPTSKRKRLPLRGWFENNSFFSRWLSQSNSSSSPKLKSKKSTVKEYLTPSVEITCARKFPSVQVYPPISNLAQFCLKPMFSYVVSCHYCPLSFNSLVSAGCGPSRAVSNCQLLRVSTEFKKITDLKIGIGP